MEITDKYLGLIHTYIYDKRRKMCGMISDLRLSNYIGGYFLSYDAYMNGLYTSIPIFVDDFEKGNVVFLMSYDTKIYNVEMENICEIQRKHIKEFFGDKFRDDMILEIYEEDRQKEIREWAEKLCSLENWTKRMNENPCCEL